MSQFQRAASRFRTGYPQADLRVSDAERAEVADRLAEHYADGRLDQTEFNERLDRTMAAKTQSDLHGLLADLPPKDPGPPPAKPSAAVRRRERHAGRPSAFGRLLRVALLVVGVLVVASVIHGVVHSLFFWGFSWWVWAALLVLVLWRFGPRRRC